MDDDRERLQPTAATAGGKGYRSQRLTRIASDSTCSSSDDESDVEGYSTPTKRRSRGDKRYPAQWWFQEPAIRKNWWIVLLSYFILFLGISSVAVGAVLEALYHSGSQEIIRGLVFFIVGFLILLPSTYAVVHICLAAKRIGRVRFSSVWFFSNL